MEDQIKGIKNKLFNVSDLKKAIPDMFSNYVTAKGKCKCILVTNASLGRKLKTIMKYKENKNKNVANAKELSKLKPVVPGEIIIASLLYQLGNNNDITNYM